MNAKRVIQTDTEVVFSANQEGCRPYRCCNACIHCKISACIFMHLLQALQVLIVMYAYTARYLHGSSIHINQSVRSLFYRPRAVTLFGHQFDLASIPDITDSSYVPCVVSIVQYKPHLTTVIMTKFAMTQVKDVNLSSFYCVTSSCNGDVLYLCR